MATSNRDEYWKTRKRQVCRKIKKITSIIYSDLTLEDATKVCQSLNDEAGIAIPQYFVRIQRGKA